MFVRLRWLGPLCFGVLLYVAGAGFSRDVPSAFWSDVNGDFLISCVPDLRPSRGSSSFAFNQGAVALASLQVSPRILRFLDPSGKTLWTSRLSHRRCPLFLALRQGNLSVGVGGRWVGTSLPVGPVTRLGTPVQVDGTRLRFQPLSDPFMEDDFMRSEGDQGEWEPLQGQWAVAPLAESAFNVNAFCYRGEGSSAEAVTGYPFWDRLRFRCALKRTAAAGLLFGIEGPSGPYLLRVDGDRGEGSLTLMRGGRDSSWEPILSVPAGAWAGQWQDLCLNLGEGEVQATLDGQSLLKWPTRDMCAGRVGLWVEGSPCLFDDFRVGPLSADLTENVHRLEPKAFSDLFFSDSFMQKWSREESFWDRSAESWQHTGMFVGPLSLSVDLSPEIPPGQWTELSLQDAGPESPSWMGRIERVGDGWTVSMGGGSSGQTRGLTVPATTRSILFRRSESRMSLEVPGQAESLDIPAQGSILSMKGPVDLRNSVTMESEQIRDYTFNASPTDWYVAKGTWAVQSRWACTPRWNWLGGRGPEVVSILHKDVFEGDVMVEAFMAFQMDTPFFPMYAHPGDLNISVCAHGTDLESGYTFIYGGWNNTRTAIVRQGKILAQRGDVLLPDNREFASTATALHKLWYRVRAEKRGGSLKFYVEDTLVLEATDPEPLSEGRVALWSVDCGLMVARARLYGQSRPEALRPVIPEHVPPPRPGWTLRHSIVKPEDWYLRSDGSDLKVFGGLRNGIIVQDVFMGGSLSVGPKAPEGMKPFDGSQTSLKFSYAFSPKAKINLYLQAHDTLCCVPLTGPEAETPGSMNISDPFPVQQDGRWHEADIPIGRLLSKAFPDAHPCQVSDLFLGNLNNDSYLQAGFGGNGPGTWYGISRLRWTRDRSLSAPSCAAFDEEMRILSRLYQGDTVADFEDGFDGFLNPWGSQGASILRDPFAALNGQYSLRLTNPVVGGTAGCVAINEPFSPKRFPVLRFAYKVDEDLRVDLLVDMGDRVRSIGFTDVDLTWAALGSIEGILRDEAWHVAEVPLFQWIQKAFPGEDPLVHRILFSSAGWPGNRKNVTYGLDDFALIESKPTGDSDPPIVSSVIPSPDTQADLSTLVIQIQDQGQGLDPGSLRLRVKDEIFSLNSPGLTFDPQNGRLTWSMHRLPKSRLVAEDGERIEAQLWGQDWAGNVLDRSWTWTLSRSMDHEPPASVWVSVLSSDCLVRYDFEKDLGGWGSFVHFRVLREQGFSATGEACAELCSLVDAGTVGALVREMDFDLERYPFVSFEYKADPNVVAKSGKLWLTGLAYNGIVDSWPSIATYDCGLEWRRASVNVGAFVAAMQKEGEYLFRRISLGESGAMAERAGARFYVDNFSIHGPPTPSISFEWNPPLDLSGIAGYSYVVDRLSDTQPAEEINLENPSLEFRGSPGSWFLHLAACDRAGNWSPPTHVPFELGPAL